MTSTSISSGRNAVVLRDHREAGRLRCHDDHVSVAELFDTLTHGIPDLHGAACAGRPELFDVADRHDPTAQAAKAICATCPVLGACRQWLNSLPRWGRPCGIVAGRYVSPLKPRPVRCCLPRL